MAWARLDDQFWSNPKIVAAGNAAAGIYARALCYCSANNTDGFVPASVARQISVRRAALQHLVSVRLLTEVSPGDVLTICNRKDSGRRKLPDVVVTIEADGYYIRDYLHYNRARSDVRADESADERASVQISRADESAFAAHKDARASRPDPALPLPNKEPLLPSNESREGEEGNENGVTPSFDLDAALAGILKDMQ